MSEIKISVEEAKSFLVREGHDLSVFGDEDALIIDYFKGVISGTIAGRAH